MSKSKTRKHEIGTSRSTENRAVNLIIHEQVREWLERINKASRFVYGDGINSRTERIADVFEELIEQTRQGKYSREVISGLVSVLATQPSTKAALLIVQKRRSH